MGRGGVCINLSAPAAANGGASINRYYCHHDHQASTKALPSFQMPLHYPRYKKIDYEKMPERQLDNLLSEYGLPVVGNVEEKRRFAMGAFLWPDQY